MKMWRYFGILSLFMVVAGLASCAGPAGRMAPGSESPGPEGVVFATVGEERITEADFLRALARVPAAYREKYLTPEGKRQLVRSLIEDELFYQEGKALGLDRTAAVEAEVEDFRRRIIREKISDNLKRDVGVGDSDMERYYRENYEKYFMPEKFRLSIIMVGLSKDPPPEEVAAAEKKAVEIIERLNDGEEFEWLAGQLSDHSSAKKGGDLGFLTIDEIPPDIKGEASELAPVGVLSDPLRGEMGIYIVKIAGKQPSAALAFDEVKGDIERTLLEEAHSDAYKALLEELEEETDIEVNSFAIDRIGIKQPGDKK